MRMQKQLLQRTCALLALSVLLGFTTAEAQQAYSPPIERNPISDTLVESSGLQMAGHSLWSFNDSGHDPAIYRIDTATGFIQQTVFLGGATNVDWEDIAFDGTFLYIGDFGNNASGARNDLKIYKLAISDIPDYTVPDNKVVTIPSTQIGVINFTYSNQPLPLVPTGSPNTTKFDCEAMIVMGGNIHLFSKNWAESKTTHYKIAGTSSGTYSADSIETFDTQYLVTAADVSPNSKTVILLGYQGSGSYNHFIHLLTGFSGGKFFNGTTTKLNLPNVFTMGQAEGIAFLNNSYGYISNESVSALGVSQKLRSFDVSGFLPAYVLPLELKSFLATKQNSGNLVQWDFASPVKELRLQVSSNRIDYTTVQSVAVSESGRFLHQPTSIVNCYRLVWKKDDGSDAYSDVVCVKSPAQGNLSKLVLRSNGALSFVLGGTDLRRLSFRLLTTDGKLLAQTAQQTVAPGANQIRFAKVPHPDTILLVQAIGDDESHSLLLKVE